MYLAGKRARLLAVIFVAAACTEEPATAPTEASWAEDLDLVLPALTPEQFVARSTFTSDPPVGPMANSEPPPPDADDWDDYEWAAVASDIWNHKTRANFVPGALVVIGSHEYQGNVASISTTGTVAYQGQTIGTQSAYAQQSLAFLVGFLPNFIWVEARIYVDKECGLNGWGTSRHEAGWQAVMGGPVSEFTKTARSSTSERAYQPECPPEPIIPAGGGSDDYSGDRVMCYFWIEYDLYTGEILDAWLMYCSGGG